MKWELTHWLTQYSQDVGLFLARWGHCTSISGWGNWQSCLCGSCGHLPLLDLSGVHLLSLWSRSWSARVLGSLCWTVGAEGLRHLDDRGSLPVACSHNHHLSGNIRNTGWTLTARHSTAHREPMITCSRQHYPIMMHETWMKVLFCCLYKGCYWHKLFDKPLGTVVGVM